MKIIIQLLCFISLFFCQVVAQNMTMGVRSLLNKSHHDIVITEDDTVRDVMQKISEQEKVSVGGLVFRGNPLKLDDNCQKALLSIDPQPRQSNLVFIEGTTDTHTENTLSASSHDSSQAREEMTMRCDSSTTGPSYRVIIKSDDTVNDVIKRLSEQENIKIMNLAYKGRVLNLQDNCQDALRKIFPKVSSNDRMSYVKGTRPSNSPKS